MRKFTMMIFAAISFAACNSSASTNTATDTTVTDTASAMNTANTMNTDTGWINLFDGSTLNGWHTFGATSVSPKWAVDSGAIHFNPDTKGDDGDLVTNDSYANFDLK